MFLDWINLFQKVLMLQFANMHFYYLLFLTDPETVILLNFNQLSVSIVLVLWFVFISPAASLTLAFYHQPIATSSEGQPAVWFGKKKKKRYHHFCFHFVPQWMQVFCSSFNFQCRLLPWYRLSKFPACCLWTREHRRKCAKLWQPSTLPLTMGKT